MIEVTAVQWEKDRVVRACVACSVCRENLLLEDAGASKAIQVSEADPDAMLRCARCKRQPVPKGLERVFYGRPGSLD